MDSLQRRLCYILLFLIAGCDTSLKHSRSASNDATDLMNRVGAVQYSSFLKLGILTDARIQEGRVWSLIIVGTVDQDILSSENLNTDFWRPISETPDYNWLPEDFLAHYTTIIQSHELDIHSTLGLVEIFLESPAQRDVPWRYAARFTFSNPPTELIQLKENKERE